MFNPPRIFDPHAPPEEAKQVFSRMYPKYERPPNPSNFIFCLQIIVIQYVNRGQNWKGREVVHITQCAQRTCYLQSF